MLKLINITKEYQVAGNCISALNGISIEFRHAEFVSILGPSGCGKTTTMNIVGGLDRYTQGDLIIEGISTKDYKDNDWDNYRNKRVGFVFQAYNLISHLSVLGNVELAMTIAGVSKTERIKAAKEALINVGLEQHLTKKPNQLSGGQMQRVAIARAIVNSPDILLMDEPTGALDTKTSEQIMKLIQKIAKDKLVIMVTHNPELAEIYSTRIIKLKDGELLDDSNPYDSSREELNEINIKDNHILGTNNTSNKKSSMSYRTSLGLSARNLLTKKKRGIMTSIACAIGIIGIGLVLALTTGLGNYVNKVTRASAESAPITITDGAGEIIKLNNNTKNDIPINQTNDYREVVPLPTNKEAVDFIMNMDSNLFNERATSSGITLSVYKKDTNDEYSRINGVTDSLASSINGIIAGTGYQFKRSPSNINLIKNQYDVVAGEIPQDELSINNAFLVLNNDGSINDSLLSYLNPSLVSKDKVSFDDLLGTEYRIPSNDQIYKLKNPESITETEPPFEQVANKLDTELYDDEVFKEGGGQIITITTILKKKENIDSGIFTPGIKFSSNLFTKMQSINKNSLIIKWMSTQMLKEPEASLSTLRPFKVSTSSTPNQSTYIPSGGSVLLDGQAYTIIYMPQYLREWLFAQLGGSNDIWEINLIANSYQSKQTIVDNISNFNSNKPIVAKIFSIDLVEMLANVFNQILNVITIVLIGFTSISLVVSAVMISIITSISVLERTKEIGILRSIGARKKDVTRLFNAENLILGFASGTVGVVFTFLFATIIGVILNTVLGATGLAVVTWFHVLILLGVSTVITLASGYLPSLDAAKKDPVVALRSE
ncbi:MAG: ABC transporter ATP-binding protein/permease [Firmicutes bacterium]|nr:ABC transporter ATP-binding protein/permease [Bacillota bacterium]